MALITATSHAHAEDWIIRRVIDGATFTAVPVDNPSAEQSIGKIAGIMDVSPHQEGIEHLKQLAVGHRVTLIPYGCDTTVSDYVDFQGTREDTLLYVVYYADDDTTASDSTDVATIERDDSADIAMLMLRHGYATTVPFCDLWRWRKYLEAEMGARDESRGIWAMMPGYPNPLHPHHGRDVLRPASHEPRPQPTPRERLEEKIQPKQQFTDPGKRDTILVQSIRQVSSGEKFAVEIRMTIDEQINGTSIPLLVEPHEVHYDSAQFRPGIASHIDLHIANAATYDKTGRILLGSLPMGEADIPVGRDSLYCRLFFTVPESVEPHVVTISKTEIPPQNTLMFVTRGDFGNRGIVPVFVPGRIGVNRALEK